MVQKILLLILNIRKKKITKLSIICNKNNFIHSVEVFYSKMIYQLLTFLIIDKSKYFNLLGNKAYKTKEIFKLNNKNIKY